MNDCGGPHPARVAEAYVKRIESAEYYQHELFSVSKEKIFYPAKDGFIDTTFYITYPYERALKTISNYQKAFYEVS